MTNDYNHTMRMTAAEREARMLAKLTAEGWTVSAKGPRCCICGCTIPTVSAPDGQPTGIGRNNPAPIVADDGSVCCATCNEKYVIPSRIAQMDNSAGMLLALADRMRANDCTPMAVQGAFDLAATESAEG